MALALFCQVFIDILNVLRINLPFPELPILIIIWNEAKNVGIGDMKFHKVSMVWGCFGDIILEEELYLRQAKISDKDF